MFLMIGAASSIVIMKTTSVFFASHTLLTLVMFIGGLCVFFNLSKQFTAFTACKLSHRAVLIASGASFHALNFFIHISNSFLAFI